MRIRHADPARDGAGCAAIYGPFVQESAASFEERVPSGADLAQRIEQIERTHPWIVAEDEGRITGFAYGCPHRERAAYRWAAEVTVYVDPAFHRRGVGRALYRALLELLREQGLWMACAGITLPNEASVALHESLGFVPVGVYRRIGYKAGRWWDVGWWQLPLRSPADGPPSEPRPPLRGAASSITPLEVGPSGTLTAMEGPRARGGNPPSLCQVVHDAVDGRTPAQTACVDV